MAGPSPPLFVSIGRGRLAVFLWCTSLKTRVPPKTSAVPSQWTAVNSFSKYQIDTSSETNFLSRV